jgi:hypothetical protein
MSDSEISEVVFGYGHANIFATHETTFEFTKDRHLSKRGNCIVAVAASKALADLNAEFKKRLKKSKANVSIQIEVEQLVERINAYGSPRLILTHPRDMVVRRSDYVCSRTLAIKADKAARDFSRVLVRKIANPKQKVKISLKVSV